MSGLPRAAETPFFSRMRPVSTLSHVFNMRVTQAMKCSGVLPVGREIAPPGLSCAHSIKRIAARRPSAGKLLTISVAIFSCDGYAAA